MPLVFVHGVNVRQGSVYDREIAFRNRHFAEILFQQLGREADENSIYNPYWGDLGASLSADAPFLPRGGYDMLWHKQSHSRSSSESKSTPEGHQDHQDVLPDLIASNSTTPLIDMAKTASLSEVIDLLWTLMDEGEVQDKKTNPETEKELARLAQRALNFSNSPEGEQWLKTLKSDDELLERLSSLLSTKAEPTQKKGIVEMLAKARSRFRERLGQARQRISGATESLTDHVKDDVASARLNFRERAVSTTAKIFNEPIRAIFHQQCALLIGDAFAYFSARGDSKVASPIAERVIESLRSARAKADKSGDELIVIGHSMGGVILCDIVTCYGKDIPIDVLITVGSQFPLFADLQMFPGIKGEQRPIPKPENIKTWINIFDPHDFLGYPASHIFSGVHDFHLPTYALGASSHTNYFNRRSFYFQLARRLSGYVAPKKP